MSIPLPTSEVSSTMELLGRKIEVVSGSRVVGSMDAVSSEEKELSDTVKSVLVSTTDSITEVVSIRLENTGDELSSACEGVMSISIELLEARMDVAMDTGDDIDVDSISGDDIDVDSISDDNVGIKNDVSSPLPISEVSTTAELLGMNMEVVSGN